MNPRLILAGLGAALVVPPLAWLGVAASASPTPQDSTPAAAFSTAAPLATPTLAASAPGEPTPVATPAAATQRPDPLAAQPSASPAGTASPSSRPATSTTPTPSPTPTKASPTPTPSPTPAKASPTPTATTKAPAPKATTPKPAKAARVKTRIANGWAPPALTPGSRALTTPALSSKAKVSVTVACQPTAGCTLAGGALSIEPGTDVTVTWSAPATDTHTGWSMTRSARN